MYNQISLLVYVALKTSNTLKDLFFKLIFDHILPSSNSIVLQQIVTIFFIFNMILVICDFDVMKILINILKCMCVNNNFTIKYTYVQCCS